METADAAMFVALLAVFAAGVVYVRVNEVAHEVEDLKRERKAAMKASQTEAGISLSHHRSGERPRGALVVHNVAKGVARDVVVQVHRTSAPLVTPLIPGGTVAMERLTGGQRMTIDTTTERDDAWPIDVLVTWSDARGPQSLVQRVER